MNYGELKKNTLEAALLLIMSGYEVTADGIVETYKARHGESPYQIGAALMELVQAGHLKETGTGYEPGTYMKMIAGMALTKQDSEHFDPFLLTDMNSLPAGFFMNTRKEFKECSWAIHGEQPVYIATIDKGMAFCRYYVPSVATEDGREVIGFTHKMHPIRLEDLKAI